MERALFNLTVRFVQAVAAARSSSNGRLQQGSYYYGAFYTAPRWFSWWSRRISDRSC